MYSLKEIIEIAIEMERAGNEFYLSVAKKFPGGQTGEVFAFLASEELTHLKTFESMLESVPRREGIFTEEYYAYLKSVGGDEVFAKKRDIATIVSSLAGPLDAVNRAFHDEKNSILLYSEMKRLYTGGSEEDTLLDKIIGEERRHVQTLLALSEKIKQDRG